MRVFIALLILLNVCGSSAELVIVPSESVADIETDEEYDWRIASHRKAYSRVLTPEQVRHPLIQNILRNSGRQAYLPDPRILLDIHCFKTKYGESVFQAKQAREDYKSVCNQFQNLNGGKKPINTFKMTKPCETLIVDYTIDQNYQRGWLIDTCKGEILRGPFSVAQGRGDGSKYNTVQGPNMNTINNPVTYTSNTPDTNTSAGGFFIATQTYMSPNVGLAMNMQGVEAGVNDNACDRRTVVHSGDYVVDNVASGLSKGCIVMDSDTNKIVSDTIAGSKENKPGKYSGGGLIYVVTSAEKANLGRNCGRDVMVSSPPVPLPRNPKVYSGPDKKL